jgi:hypothetical protein
MRMQRRNARVWEFLFLRRVLLLLSGHFLPGCGRHLSTVMGARWVVIHGQCLRIIYRQSRAVDRQRGYNRW